jgi:hypothetical protein
VSDYSDDRCKAAEDEVVRLTSALAEAQREIAAIRAALEGVVASAHPHPDLNPAMALAWARAKAALGGKWGSFESNVPPHIALLKQALDGEEGGK